MAREAYENQVQLLVACLPAVAKQEVFALKGGTAINLFYRDMPRLSVDIDLTYLPIEDRTTSLANIDATLDTILADISQAVPNVEVKRIAGGSDIETRILVRQQGATIKIETSPVARGTVHKPVLMPVSDAVQERFGFAEMPVVAFEDLFAGKFHAATDRQHPRDIFDVKLLYENEGVTTDLFRTFLIYVASSGRPPHELIRPTPQPLEERFVAEFEGMTANPITVAELEKARARFFADILGRLDEPATKFLLTLHDGEPDFDSIGLPLARELPAIKWKLQNLEKLKKNNPDKHAALRKDIEGLVE
jgi:predicted nucleotidyltransferase component of viral defense system